MQDPSPGRFRTNAYDIGEYGAGPMTNSLELGCDCLGEIRYLDAVVHDARGEPTTIKNAICMHEEDSGLLWKHYDWVAEDAEVRRSRRFVISSIITAANYEYAFYWYLYQDGTIETEVKLTGIVLTSAVHLGQKPEYGRLVSPGLSALNHQHFFCVARHVRGWVCERRARGSHGARSGRPANPHGNAFKAVATKLKTEREAQQMIDPLNARFWRISNPTSRNGLGEPVAYKLLPGTNVRPFAASGSSVLERAGFMEKHLWVTPCMRPPSGIQRAIIRTSIPGAPAYPNGPRPTDRSSRRTSSSGTHSAPRSRAEDWPVMPVVRRFQSCSGRLLRPQPLGCAAASARPSSERLSSERPRDQQVY